MSNNFPKFHELSLTDFPRDIPASSYHDVRKSMIEYFSTSADVIGLYEFGTVKAPPISDIDLLVVLKDEPSDKIHDFLNRESVDSLSRYLMMDNTLMVVNEEGFRNVPLWDDMKFRCLYGKDIVQKQLDDKRLYYTEIARVLDWLPERTLRFLELINRREIPVRVTLCVVNSFIYVLRRLKDVFDITFVGADEYIEKFHQLRISWLTTKNNNEILYDFILQSIKLGFQAMHAFDDYIISEGLYDPREIKGTGTFLLNPTVTTWTKQKLYYHFSDDRTCITPTISVSRSGQDSTVIIVPHTYYQHLALYASCDGHISNGIRGSLSPTTSINVIEGIDDTLRDVLQNRMEACNKMGEFLQDNSIQRGLLKFGWFL